MLVEPQWLTAHRDDPRVRVLEAAEDPLLYQAGHIPGAGCLRWEVDLQSETSRDLLSGPAFAVLMGRLGISRDTTVVLYGDRLNGWAFYAYWVLRYWGHRDVRVLDGGHARWQREGHPLTRDIPSFSPTSYAPPTACPQMRADAQQVLTAAREQSATLLDARPAAQYGGAHISGISHPAAAAHRAGHIPGAVNVPWTAVADGEGRLRGAADLRRLYRAAGVDLGRPIIAYCAIGVGSAVAYAVLHDLLGCSEVRNYDGSWLEWGSLMGYPIAPAAALAPAQGED
jgi:thiosulfate/3-mercaptopyruvate sulfurtransferase